MKSVISLEKQILASLDSTRLNLIILPTEKCNFRCFYCYEDFEIGKMVRPIIDSLKKLIESRFEDLEELEISWFGGEPLVAKEIIYEISDFVIDNGPSRLNFFSNITTNGFLLDFNTFEELVKRKVKLFQISIDGD